MRMAGLVSSLLLTLLAVCSCGASARQQDRPGNTSKPAPQQPSEKKTPEPRAAVDPNKFAVIVAGAGGEDAYTKKFSAQAAQLYDAVTARLGFDEKHVFLLTEGV